MIMHYFCTHLVIWSSVKSHSKISFNKQHRYNLVWNKLFKHYNDNYKTLQFFFLWELGL